jgi:hypothetical protein
MATKRRPISRAVRANLTPDLKVKAERLLELNEQHLDAIRGGDQSFYSDGRSAEMIDLGPEVRAALAIMPWHDEDAMLRAALGRAER